MSVFKAFSIAALVLASAAQSQAACFNFVNDNGPSQIGDVALYGPASRVCVQQLNGFAGPVTTVVLSDAQGTLAQFSANVTATGRCLGYCQEVELGYGNANGQNVSAQGTRLRFQVEPDMHLGITKGTLTVANPYGSAQNYLVVGKK